ncbi:helix-turn-helix transcriptional regulator [uncultured Acetobacteroides sp.]|uniref:AraC family transcriptional regulator n=1 Tax=uncultured Acetobacteroides sp. TaxID=1760811 RepID=UPI0029F48611|nr:helix-turn-helix transcriptional regulator [uncultured Acetobacteroides sp.]
MIAQYDFFKNKYGEELLIDLIALKDIERYIRNTPIQRLTYFDITFIASGCGTFAIDSCEEDIAPNRIFFSSPGQVRKWNVTDIPDGYALIFEEEFLCTFFSDAQFVQSLSFFYTYSNPPVLDLSQSEFEHIAALLHQIKNELTTFKHTDKHLLRALLYQILVLLNRHYSKVNPLSSKSQSNRYVGPFMQLVNAQHQQNRSVDHYAQLLHITSGHLNSLVKECCGVNAKRYILSRSILEAKRLLLYSDLTIDEIAANLGYETTSYFVRAFKEHTGITPLHFKKQ